MKRRKMIIAAIVAVTVLAAGGTALAAKSTRVVQPTLTLSASEARHDSIDASGQYSGGKGCGHHRPVTLYEGSHALASTRTSYSGSYSMNSGRLSHGSHTVFTRVPGRHHGHYGHIHICNDATSNPQTVVIH